METGRERDIQSGLKKRALQINEILERYLPKEEGFVRTVLEAMNYSVHVGGKRLRPVLLAECFSLYGGEGALAEPFLAAIELIHTYSLVHDDLPAMDNDLWRRGHKTTHAVYGEAMAILTGDALLNYAFETALTAFGLPEAKEPEVCMRIAKALQLLAKKAGINGMIGGQVADVESEKKALTITEEKLDFIYRAKTGALMEASMMIGALLAGAREAEVLRMERVAAKVGMAFQIQDDILDVTGTQEELGKPIGSDERNEKATYLSFAGMEEAREQVGRLSREAVEELLQVDGDTAFLRGLILRLIDRSK